MIFRSFIKAGFTLSKNVGAQRAKQLFMAAPAASFSQMSQRGPNSNLFNQAQSTQISKNIGLNRFLNRYVFLSTQNLSLCWCRIYGSIGHRVDGIQDCPSLH